MSKRWLPAPRLSLVLMLTWLMLNQSLSVGQLLLGALFGLGIPYLGQAMQPLPAPRLRRPWLLVSMFFVALVDIIRSALNVARIILLTRPRGIHSQFIRVPLELTHPHALAILSCIINTTPGTVWAEILPGSTDLALHVFDLHDEAWWVRTIKAHYETPLLIVFEGREP